MTVEQKYLDFLDALLEIEKRTCCFQDPQDLFDRDFLVLREYMRRKEEEISIIKISDFKLDESIKEEYLILDLINMLFLKRKIEKRFRRQSEIPLGENQFYERIAHRINLSVLEALDSVGFPKPIIGVRSNWIFVNFQGTSYQITNIIKLYDFDSCERVFYEILRILLPELKRMRLMKTLEEIIIFVKQSLKKKIIEEEAQDIIQDIKNDCQNLLKEKEIEKEKLIQDCEAKYRVLLEENKSLIEYKTKFEKLEKEISFIKIAEIKIPETEEEKLIEVPVESIEKEKIIPKKKVEVKKETEIVEGKPKKIKKKTKSKKKKTKKKKKATKTESKDEESKPELVIEEKELEETEPKAKKTKKKTKSKKKKTKKKKK